jgi:ADP-heptose:LPS heptosyltransferase
MKEKILYFLNYLTGKLYRHKPISKLEIKSILIVKLDEIGDMVYAMPVFDILKSQFPNAKITVFCKAVTANLLDNQRAVDEIIHELNGEKHDIWIEMRGNFTTWFQSLLARPRYRVDRGTVRYRNKRKGAQKQELYTNLEIIQPLLTDEEYQMYEKTVKPIVYTTIQNEIRSDAFLDAQDLQSFCVFHTGARDVARRWPMERFQQLAQVIQSKLNLRVVIVGGPDETERVNNALQGFPPGTVSFCGAGSLTDMKTLCDKASFFVGNESGPLHIASACDIPLVGLFGPGVKDVFYPMGEMVSVIHYFSGTPGSEQNEQNSTILYISVAQVWGHIAKLLNQQYEHKKL